MAQGVADRPTPDGKPASLRWPEQLTNRNGKKITLFSDTDHDTEETIIETGW